MTGSQPRIFFPVLFQCGESFSERAAASLCAGYERSGTYSELVQHGGFSHEKFFAEAGSAPGIKVVQCVDLSEIGMQLDQRTENLTRDGRRIELDADALPIAGKRRDFFQTKSIIKPQGGDAEHTER